MFDFTKFKQNLAETETWLTSELSAIRTGRAAPAILDSVKVEAYGSKVGIKELSTVLVEDARTIRVEPWDKSQVKAIERSVIAANLGLSVNADEKGLRIVFPELTSERRQQLLKVAKSKLEEARIRLRTIRDKTWDEIQKKEKEGGMGEDDKFRLKDEMQGHIDESNKKLEQYMEKKVAEINN